MAIGAYCCTCCVVTGSSCGVGVGLPGYVQVVAVGVCGDVAFSLGVGRSCGAGWVVGRMVVLVMWQLP